MKKKLLSFLTSAVIAATCLGSLTDVINLVNVPLNAEAYEGTKYGDYLYYQTVDEDKDGTYDYVEISGCDRSAESVDIPAEIDELSVTHIGLNAFSDCTSLEKITIPDSVTWIGAFSFYNCSKLTEINLPDSVTSIGSYAFSNCSKLTGITLPDGLKMIDGYLFQGCTSLENITIPDSVSTIRGSAFDGCTKLTNVYISDIEAWCNIDFMSNPLYYADNLYLNNKLVTEVTVPEGVTQIPYMAFSSTNITDVTISDSVTDIKDHAFSGASNLTGITISNSVTNIEKYAFSGCTALENITIPASVTSIGIDVFDSCTALSDISVSENNQNYSSEDGVLFDKSKAQLIQYPVGNNRKEYSVPESVTSIGSKSFTGAVNLVSVTLNEAVANIKDYAFYNCKNLSDIKNSSGLIYIEEYAFYKCNNLSDITFPDGLISIGNMAFSGCTSLADIKIPESVSSIGLDAFSNTAMVNGQPGPLYYADTWVVDCERNVTSVEIKKDAQKIGYGVFSGHQYLESIILPANIVKVENYAFYLCSNLESITIENPDCKICDSRYTISNNTIIYGYENSTAQKYAEKYSLTFVNINDKPVVTTPPTTTVTTSAVTSTVITSTTTTLKTTSAVTDTLPVSTGTNSTTVSTSVTAIVTTTVVTTPEIKGDANGDGLISIADIVQIQKCLLNIITEVDFNVVDVNDDGKFNVFDVIIVRRIVLNN